MRRGRQIAFFLIYALNNGANIFLDETKAYYHNFLDRDYLESLREDFDGYQNQKDDEHVLKLLKERFRLDENAVIEHVAAYENNEAATEQNVNTAVDLLKDSPQADELGKTHLSHNEMRYIENTVTGVMEEKSKIEQTIENALIGWKLERLGAVEKAILMLGTYELLYTPQVDAPIVINEALDLVKTYGDAERSPKLINGVLDNIYQNQVKS